MACPICNKAGVPQYRPFCSKRCADIDLGRWLRGAYVIPGQPLDDLASDGVPDGEGHEKNRDGGLDSRGKRP
ncbi:DNA gyrase inhibitor YacG [Paracoccus sp. YIM 132242]|uniref:DNA gyrase inhibitor YacG n=1 Tax=Paracoccus lichenicola TaxID=2665644 RepID=A0A6L6HNF4_9RHOB|nr:DNA gyrase inhibitor YacG [Paracoccus lichenicola]MTD99712.1 DNA gyrase inhibitor YacG [Paracoccus lichenicola]